MLAFPNFPISMKCNMNFGADKVTLINLSFATLLVTRSLRCLQSIVGYDRLR